MAKSKKDEPCYTRTNKAGGTYVTCEGSQKGSSKGKPRISEKDKAGVSARKKKRQEKVKKNIGVKPQGTRVNVGKLNPGKVVKDAPKKQVPSTSPKKNHVQLNEENKEGKIIKRTVVNVNDLFDAVVKPLQKKGYSFAKFQLTNIQENVTRARNLPDKPGTKIYYGTGSKKGQLAPLKTTSGEVSEYSYWYITPSKGKTDMMIISVGDVGQRLFSTRVKKPIPDKYMERVKFVRANHPYGDTIAFVSIDGEKYDWDGVNVKDAFGKKVAQLKDPELLERWFQASIHKYNIPEVGKNKGLKITKKYS